MAVNLVELVSSAITPDTVQSISRVLGERDAAVQTGIAALVPALIGGLAGKASTPSGATNLLGMLNGADVDEGMMSNLGSMLGAGQPEALLQQGSNLLGGLFGTDKASRIADSVAGMTGMKTGSATNLLMMIVPMILGMLKRFISERRLGSSELSSMLADQRQFLDGKLDPRLTSAMGFGSPSSLLAGLGETAATTARGAAATVGRAGATVGAATAAASTAATSGSGRSWLPWALAAVVAAVLIAMLPRLGDRGGSSVAQAPAPATTTAKTDSTPAPASATEAAPAGTTSAMGAAPASLPAKIYFETGKAELGPDGTAVVKSVVGMLAANPSTKVDLTGFTDKTGDTAANQELAKKRAGAVKAALEAAGVAPERVGMREPMFVEVGAGGSDAEARRVDIAATK